MTRPRPEDISSAGQDSFLDVITNIVGILIILVMVVGGRVQQIILTAIPQSAAEAESLHRQIRELENTVVSSESEIGQLASQTRTLAMAASLAGEARVSYCGCCCQSGSCTAERGDGCLPSQGCRIYRS